MAVDTLSPSSRPSVLDQPFSLARINWEVAAYGLVIVLSVVAHLWGLGTMALHHDESIHAWMSWKFYTGHGDFRCANGETFNTYCYDPVYHGPSLYILTGLSYFLFGDGDVQARLPMALAGIGLVASCWMLRPYLGRRGALVAAVLLGFTPALLYYTRFARHDGLMVLWELWMVIGMLRYLDTGKSGYLYLLAAALALAIGTHELYYILLFIFGFVLLVRLVYESSFKRYLNWGMAGILLLAGIFILINPPLPVGEGLYFGEKMALLATAMGLTWLASRVWSPKPVLIPRFVKTWREQRNTLWIALAILLGLHTIMYTTFFAYPLGIIGPLDGLTYWLGSQQEFARGDQPWYYYLMLIGIYEPLGLVAGLGAAIYLFARKRPEPREPAAEQNALAADSAPAEGDGHLHAEDNGKDTSEAPPRKGKRKGKQRAQAATEEVASPEPHATPAPVAALAPPRDPLTDVPTGNLFPLLLVVWYFSAIVIFSWAGEKMPWLLVHMALPGNLIAAWVIGRLLRVLPPLRSSATDTQQAEASADEGKTPAAPGWMTLLVPPALLVMLIALAVALWRFYQEGDEGRAAQINLLQGLVPLLIFGVMVYALLTLAQYIRLRVVLAAAALTVITLLGGYMIRASWLAVYTHPDTAIELLVYTQTSPDVPRYVEQIRELAINQTRNYRNEEDVTGGLSMPIILSGGNQSVAWPMQWYLRDFQRIHWKQSEDLQNASRETFTVSLPSSAPQETRGLAPVVMLASAHIDQDIREILDQHYVQPYGPQGVFNWWFPEGNKCAPDEQGYKRFYFDTVTSQRMIEEPPQDGCYDLPEDATEAQIQQRNANIEELRGKIHDPWMPLVWPFLPNHLEDTWNYLMFRDLPEPLRPGSRDMEVWLRADLVTGMSQESSAAGGSDVLRLLAEQAIGVDANMGGPTDIAIDSEGRIYVSDTASHQILLFDSEGELERTIGSFGSDEGQFYEPRGLAVDADDNLYVADTWNARIVKLDPEGEWLATWGEGEPMNMYEGDTRLATMNNGDPTLNEENPLGFFGPRDVAVDATGNIFIADTGNQRIVVTDDEGEFFYQWGSLGSQAGNFDEPAAVAVDQSSGLVYVADTWNSRVQVFEQDAQGVVPDLPLRTWSVRGWEPDTYADPSIAISPDGRVYLSIPLRNQVASATPNGLIVLRWGGAGEDLASLNNPTGMAFDDEGVIYVVDRASARVLQFELPRVLPPSPTQ